jgi:hypothetical protein
MAAKLTPYEKIAPEMQTGDVVLMCGRFRFSGLFQWFQHSKWDHVGIVIRPEDVGIDFDGVLYWESNPVALQDVRNGRYHSGPQLDSLRDRMVVAQGFTKMEFAWRHLEVDRDAEALGRIRDFLPTVSNASFPSDFKLFAYLLLGRWFGIRTNPHELGCSETASLTLQAAGWLARDYVPNGFDPRDYSAQGSLPLVDGARLGPEVPLAVPEPRG